MHRLQLQADDRRHDGNLRMWRDSVTRTEPSLPPHYSTYGYVYARRNRAAVRSYVPGL